MSDNDDSIVYNRPISIVIDINEYIDMYGSVERAKTNFFNIGAGIWQHPCWSNIDLAAQTPEFARIQAPCIYHDLVKNKGSLSSFGVFFYA
jgi:hypothetical protein